jgi:hypothetical protein
MADPQKPNPIDAIFLNMRLNDLQDNGHGDLDPAVQTQLAINGGSQKNMLNTAAIIKNVNKNVNKTTPTAWADPAHNKPVSNIQKAMEVIRTGHAPLPGNSADVQKFQEGLQAKGYGKDLTVGVWNPEWQTVIGHYRMDAMKRPGVGNVDSKKFWKTILEEVMPSKWASDISHFVHSLPDSARQVLTDVATEAGNYTDKQNLIDMFNPQISKTEQELFDARQAQRMNKISTALGKPLDPSKLTEAERQARVVEDFGTVFNLMLASGVGKAAFKAVGEVAAKYTAKQMTEKSATGAIKDIFTRSLPEDMAKPPKFTVVNSIYSAGINGGKGTGLLRAFENTPVLKRMLPNLGWDTVEGSRYYNFKNFFAQNARIPSLQIGARLQGKGTLLGLGLLGTSAAQKALGGTPTYDATKTEPYGGVLGNTLDVMGFLVGNPSKTLSSSQNVGQAVSKAHGVINQVGGNLNMDFVIKKGLGMSLKDLNKNLGSAFVNDYFLNTKVNQFAASHYAHNVLDAEVRAGKIDRNTQEYQDAFMKYEHEAINDPVILTQSRESLILQPEQLAAYFKQDAAHILGNNVRQGIDEPYKVTSKDKTRYYEAMKREASKQGIMADALHPDVRNLWHGSATKTKLEDMKTKGLKEEWAADAPGFDDTLGIVGRSPKLFHVNPKVNEFAPEGSKLARTTPYGAGVTATDNVGLAGRAKANIYSLTHTPEGGELPRIYDMTQKGNSTPISEQIRQILGGTYDAPAGALANSTVREYRNELGLMKPGKGVKKVTTEANQFHPDSVEVARDGALVYSKRAGIDVDKTINYKDLKADKERAAKIADEYEKLPVNDPRAIPYYDALIKEVQSQFDYMTKELGIEVEFVAKDPYKNSKEMMADVAKGKLKVLQTESTGSHPYFTNEQNDMFRAVHDFFGHAATGRGFAQDGEEAAWVHHSQMFSREARAALTTETRGQNSWYNTRNKSTEQRLANVPKDLQFEYLSADNSLSTKTLLKNKYGINKQQANQALNANTIIAKDADGNYVGHISWNKDTGKIQLVNVTKEMQRKGIATKLLSQAREIKGNVAKPIHETIEENLSPEGVAWKKALTSNKFAEQKIALLPEEYWDVPADIARIETKEGAKTSTLVPVPPKDYPKEYLALRSKLKNGFDYSAQEVLDAYRVALKAAGKLSAKEIDARIADITKSVMDDKKYTGFQYRDSKYGTTYVLNPERVASQKIAHDPKFNIEAMKSTYLQTDHKVERGALGLANKDTFVQQDAQKAATTLFDKLAKLGYTKDVDLARSTLQLEGMGKIGVAELPAFTGVMNKELGNILSQAQGILINKLGLDPRRVSSLDPIEAISLIWRQSKKLASEAYLPADAPRHLKDLQAKAEAIGSKFVLGTDIGHSYEAPLIHPTIVKQHTKLIKRALANAGFSTSKIDDTIPAQIRRTNVEYEIDKLFASGKVSPLNGDNGNSIRMALQQAARSGEIIQEGPIGEAYRKSAGVLFRAEKKINRYIEESLGDVSNMTYNEIQKAKKVAREKAFVTFNANHSIRDLSLKQMVKALTRPVGPGTKYGVGVERYSKEDAMKIAKAVLIGYARTPAYLVGWGRGEDFLRASNAMLTNSTASFFGKVPLINKFKIGEGPIANWYATLPNDLGRLRDKWRFDYSPVFAFRRLAKTNVKAAAEYIPPTRDPFESLRRNGAVEEAMSLLERTMPKVYQASKDTEPLDKFLLQNDIFHIYNPAHMMAWQAYNLKKLGLTEAEITQKLIKINTYGERTPLERTVNTIFYPFSFNKTLYRSVGGYILDNPGEAMLINLGFDLYHKMNLDDPNDGLGAWVKKHAPLLDELNKLNAFEHGTGLGQFTGINAPYISQFMNIFSPQQLRPWEYKDGVKAWMSAIPAMSELNTLLFNIGPDGTADLKGSIPETAMIGYWGAKNLAQHATDLIKGEKRFAYQPVMSSEGQTQAAIDFVNKMKFQLARALDSGHARFGKDPSIPEQLWGEKITATNIKRIAQIMYPEYDPTKGAAIAISKAAQAKSYVLDLKGTWRYKEYNAFQTKADSAIRKIQNTENAYAIQRLSDPLRKAAVNLAEQDPKFATFYRIYYSSMLGPIEGLTK